MKDDAVKNILNFAIGDLGSIRQITEVVVDHPEYDAEKDALKMIIKAIESIADDIREAADLLEED